MEEEEGKEEERNRENDLRGADRIIEDFGRRVGVCEVLGGGQGQKQRSGDEGSGTHGC